MSAPVEIIVNPLELWVAPVGTTFPTITTEPTDTWKKVGIAGTESESEAGVTITHNQTLATFTSAGNTTPRKAWRTDESVQIALELADLTAEAYALVLNDAAITEVAGTGDAPGTKTISLYQGIDVAIMALVARGASPYADGLIAQYNVPAAYSSATPAPKFAPKGGPALLALQFETLEAIAGSKPELIFQTPHEES